MSKAMLAHMTWPEAREALRQGRPVVVPIGSTEQHGPHLPVGTDFLVADTLGRMLADRADCIVTPTIAVGYADYHRDFAGTLSVSQATLEAYVSESVQHLVNHGATHILFVNTHGGNSAALSQVCYRLRRQGVVAATVLWWDVLGRLTPESSPAGHGDWIETSMMLACDAGSVHMELAKYPRVNRLNVEGFSIQTPGTVLYQGVPVYFRLTTADYSPSGDMPEPGLTPHGDASIPPTRASVELGQQLLETVVTFLAGLLEDFRRLQLPDTEVVCQ